MPEDPPIPSPARPPDDDVVVSLLAARTAAAWDARWPTCTPVPHTLRFDATDRWVRFHTLPGDKRYADTPAERAEILRRHNALLEELGAGPVLLVLSTIASMSRRPARRPRAPFSRYGAGGVHWRTVVESPDDPPFRSWFHVYVRETPWRPGATDKLLAAVADEELWGILLAPPDLRWLYHPYDGGMDVVLATRGERERLAARHRDWLPGDTTTAGP